MQESIRWPVTTQAEIIEISQSLGEKSQFQNGIGAVDGCHIQIKVPKQTSLLKPEKGLLNIV